MSNIVLRDYQKEAIQAFNEARGTDDNRFLLTAGVGAGKTIISSSIISAEIRERNGKALFLCHRDELIRQTVDKIALVDDTIRVGVVQAERNEWQDVDLVVASVQSISNDKRLIQYPKDEFSLVIVDETHRVTAKSYQKVLEYFGCMGEGKTVLLGITATPERTDKITLDEVYQKHIFDIAMYELIQRGALVPIKAITIQTQTDLSGIRKQMGDFNEKQLASVLNTRNRNELIAKAVSQYASNRKSLVFCVNVDHAQSLAETMSQYGIKTKAVHGRMSQKERRETLAAFSNGEIQALTTVQLLVEGYDEPTVDCIVWATKTMSLIKYTQGIGRGTRLSPDKSHLLVIDCADNSNRHSLMSVPSLFGIETRAGKNALDDGKDILEVKAIDEATKKKEEEERKRKEEEKAAGSKLSAQVIDLFSRNKFNVQDELPQVLRDSPFYWMAISNDHYFVPFFNEQLHLKRSGSSWELSFINHNYDFQVKKHEGKYSPLENAAYRADILLHRYNWMLKKYREWSKEMPSSSQNRALKKLGLPERITKLDAFHAISLSMARNYYRRKAR